MKPTDKELERAKTYLRERLGAEYRLNQAAMEYITTAATQIVKIAYKYDIKPKQFKFSRNAQLHAEVSSVVTWLREMLEQETERMAMENAENEDDVAIVFTRKIGNKTFKQRNAYNCRNFYYEVETAVIAALLAGATEQEALDAILDNLMTPYRNEYIKQAKKNANRNTRRIIDGGISFGRGRTNSMTKAIRDNIINTGASAWMLADVAKAKRGNAIGFITFRGSSYPCEQCDESARIFHTFLDPFPPLHNHCCCGMAFVYE